MIDIKKQVLGNGVRVVTIPMKGTHAVTALVLVKTGSKYEDAKDSGASHFLEHLFFKGSKHYPTPKELSEALDRLGAEFNAFTSTEETGYYVKTAKTNVELAVSIVADMLKHPKFAVDEMERERGVIIEELNMFQDTPMRHIHDVWRETLYGTEQALGRDVGGTPETISAMSHESILKHFNQYYRGENVLVCLAGAIPHKEGEALAAKHFEGIEPGSQGSFKPVIDKQDEPNVLQREKDTDQTHIALGFRGVSLLHEKRHAVAVLASLLGGLMSSRIFLKVREELGLAYAVRTSADFDTETGSMATYGGIKNDRVEAAIDAILVEHQKLRETKPPEDEVQKAKDSIVGRFVLGLEQTDEVANYVATQELLLPKVDTPEEEIEAFKRVTADDVHEMARQLFKAAHLNLAMIGPKIDGATLIERLKKFA